MAAMSTCAHVRNIDIHLTKSEIKKMKPENIVTTLETSKRLKELGVKQDSVFIWIKESLEVKDDITLYDLDKYNDIIFSAFTAEEIGDLLPEYCDKNGNNWDIIKLETGEWEVTFNGIDSDIHFSCVNKSLTEALALTYIQLKEKNLI